MKIPSEIDDLIKTSIKQHAQQKAKESGFKVGDEIVINGSGNFGTIVYDYNYIGDFGILRTTGKNKGTIAYLSHYEIKKTH